jgi:hypothetical protein
LRAAAAIVLSGAFNTGAERVFFASLPSTNSDAKRWASDQSLMQQRNTIDQARAALDSPSLDPVTQRPRP